MLDYYLIYCHTARHPGEAEFQGLPPRDTSLAEQMMFTNEMDFKIMVDNRVISMTLVRIAMNEGN